ncbi:MAG: nucleotidyltransferase family protein [Vulcanococcus sp.]|jgi:dTDP-glucose pyrophosphorylase|uniref:nucleotidyltransferase family protein n=1 Tax=Vulcanococcus sp. TaxID=2856995 RepID=UPI0025F8D668|nr:nucleotidyltransferase family protein [Vulcanococcus sp.]MBW0180971.1 nucleotidyltransferase family protein [Vulcanococcus sp.]
MERIDPFPYTVHSGTPILEALKKVNAPPLYAALIVDGDNRLCGILTDGDLRRGLLDGYDLGNAVDIFMKRDPTTAPASIPKEDANNLLKRKDLSWLPLLSELGELKALLIANFLHEENNIDNAAVIMAGGKGSRLYPLTKDCPKPMLKINGKPILEILIEQCIQAGFSNFYISVNYLKEQIIDYFGHGESMGISIDYLIEDIPLGTAGSLQLLPKTINKPFLALNGDLLTRFDYRHLMQFHADHNSSATICVREHVTQIPFGVVQTDGHRLIGFDEKPTYRQLVNAGVYVIEPSVLTYLEPNMPTDMPSLLGKVQASGQEVMVCPIHEYWLDIGRPDALYAAQLEWISVGR